MENEPTKKDLLAAIAERLQTMPNFGMQFHGTPVALSEDETAVHVRYDRSRVLVGLLPEEDDKDGRIEEEDLELYPVSAILKIRYIIS